MGIDIVYRDESIVVCVKPAGILSTDEPGGLPELLRTQLATDCVMTVHRLDRVVSGLMLLALTQDCASRLSRQIRDGDFEKSYLAVIHGRPEHDVGRFTDLLLRDKSERKTYVVQAPAKNVQEAILDYRLIMSRDMFSLVGIQLVTGRTHQIRCQFSSRGLPLLGDRKYSTLDDGCSIALWSHSLGFSHPVTGERLIFSLAPPDAYPWNMFK